MSYKQYLILNAKELAQKYENEDDSKWTRVKR